MKTTLIITVIIIISAIGLVFYSLGLQEPSQIVSDDLSSEQPLPEGKSLSINLKESVGIEAQP